MSEVQKTEPVVTTEDHKIEPVIVAESKDIPGILKEAEDCEPCKAGVVIGIADYVCKQNTGPGDGNAECSVLYDQVMTGTLKVVEYVDKVKERLKDNPDDLKTLESDAAVSAEL